MEFLTFLLITTLTSYCLASPELSTLNGHVSRSSGCTMSSNTNSSLAITFQTQFEGLVAVGDAIDSGSSGIKVSFTVTDDTNALVMQNSQVSNGDGYNTTWNFGSMFSGNITSVSLLIHKDNTTVVSVNHGPAGITNTSSLPFPQGPKNITSALAGLSNQIRAVIKDCNLQGNNSTLAARAIYSLLERRDPYGIAPKDDDTTRISSCAICLAEVAAAAVGCGVACAATLGIACGCTAGIPLLVAYCHNPGTGLGQGCCPVGCGNGEQIVGIQVVFTCCFSGDTCVNPSTGMCCASGLQACGGNTCCPSSAPCRDGGICCPTTQNTCITSKGAVCCNEGEDCVEGACCPRNDIFNGKCCPNCCTGSPPSMCGNGGIMNCINNQWVSSKCPYPLTCQNIPVQGAGAACQGSPFCSNGQPSYCNGNGYQSCVNGRWAFTPCNPPTFCLPIPFQGAGVGCSAPPP